MTKSKTSKKSSPLAVDSIRVEDGMGVFNPNRKLPLHRWYPFVEGFSSNLVDQALDQMDSNLIFDPFGGSGTTALAASLKGKQSFFTEANPFMAWVADVKINKVKDFLDAEIDPKLVRNFKYSKTPSESRLKENPFWDINIKRNFMETANAKKLVAYMIATENLDEPIKSINKLAGATAILSSSNMIRRTDLRRRTSNDKLPLDFDDVVRERLMQFSEDLQLLQGTNLVSTVCLGNDARQNWSSPEKFNLVVTSPPYLNGTNYCRNTKMELFACAFLRTEAELQGLRDRSIMAGINNVSTRKKYETTNLPRISTTVKKLEKLSYDKRIPTMVNGYFIDMGMMFNSVYDNSNPGALFLLDIGDSKFASVHVNTPELLKEIAADTGWKFKKSIQLRSRRSFDGTLLSQDLLEFGRE